MITSFYSSLIKVWAQENTAGSPIFMKQLFQNSLKIEKKKTTAPLLPACQQHC
jgi:hypothetical protein